MSDEGKNENAPAEDNDKKSSEKPKGSEQGKESMAESSKKKEKAKAKEYDERKDDIEDLQPQNHERTKESNNMAGNASKDHFSGSDEITTSNDERKNLNDSRMAVNARAVWTQSGQGSVGFAKNDFPVEINFAPKPVQRRANVPNAMPAVNWKPASFGDGQDMNLWGYLCIGLTLSEETNQDVLQLLEGMGTPLAVASMCAKRATFMLNLLANLKMDNNLTFRVAGEMEVRLTQLLNAVELVRREETTPSGYNKNYKSVPKWSINLDEMVKSFSVTARWILDEVEPRDFVKVFIKSLIYEDDKAKLKKAAEGWQSDNRKNWTWLVPRVFQALCSLDTLADIENQLMTIKPEENETINQFHERFNMYVVVLEKSNSDFKVVRAFKKALPIDEQRRLRDHNVVSEMMLYVATSAGVDPHKDCYVGKSKGGEGAKKQAGKRPREEDEDKEKITLSTSELKKLVVNAVESNLVPKKQKTSGRITKRDVVDGMKVLAGLDDELDGTY